MPHFSITYSARKEGAIGAFYPVTRNYITGNAKRAKQLCFDRLHREGYETNHCIEIIHDPTPCICGAWEPCESYGLSNAWDSAESWCPRHGYHPKPQPKQRIDPGTFEVLDTFEDTE